MTSDEVKDKIIYFSCKYTWIFLFKYVLVNFFSMTDCIKDLLKQNNKHTFYLRYFMLIKLNQYAAIFF